jgi:hypothetical protein
MEYVFLISHDAAFRPTGALTTDIAEWIQAQHRAGTRIDGRPLAPAATARTVRRGQVVATTEADAATASTERICAWELYDCVSMDEAVALACQHPMAAVATIEVRPVAEERLQAVHTRQGGR